MFTLETRGLLYYNTALGNDYCNFEAAQNDKKSNYEGTFWLDDGKWHYYTVTITETSAKVYIDGDVLNSWTLDNSTVGQLMTDFFAKLKDGTYNYICLGGNQAWDWNDADPAFGFDDFAVYDAALSASQIKQIISNKLGIVNVDIYHVFEDYSEATDASSWVTPNGLLTLVKDDETHGNYITLTQQGGGQRSGYTTFNTDGIADLSSYTLSFDYRYSFLSDRRNQVVAYNKNFVSPGNNNYYEDETKKEALINLLQTAATEKTFKLDFSENLVELEPATWYHLDLVVDVVNEKVTTTITNENGNKVLDGYVASKTGINLQFAGIWAVVGRQSTVASFDNFALVGNGVEVITPLISRSSINLQTKKETLAVSAKSNAVNKEFKYYYSVNSDLSNPEEIENGTIELSAGTYYFYAVNTVSGNKSTAIEYFISDLTETVSAPVVNISGSTVTVTNGTSDAGSGVSTYYVKYKTSNSPATEGTLIAEGENTLDQGFYYFYTISELGAVSEPTYAQVVCRGTETFSFKNLFDGGFKTINYSAGTDNRKSISSFANETGTVGRYMNGRIEFDYDGSTTGHVWWIRDANRPLFVSVNRSANFAVKVSANDAVIFNGDVLTFVDNSNIYGAETGAKVESGKVYFAKEDGFVVINGGAYAVMNSVVVYTNDEIFTDITATVAPRGADRAVVFTPAYSTSDAELKNYYTTDGSDPTSASAEAENEIIVSEDCTVKIASINTVTGNRSNILSMDVTVGEIILTTPTITLADMVASGDYYSPSFTLTSNDNFPVSFAATLDGEEVDVTSGTFVPTKSGKLSVIATAEGCTSSEPAELFVIPLYNLEKSADFSEINSSNYTEKLGEDWILNENSTRWANWSKTSGVKADGTWGGDDKYYTISQPSNGSTVYKFMRLYTNGMQLLIGYGFGRNANNNQNSTIDIPGAAKNSIAKYVFAVQSPTTSNTFVYNVDKLSFTYAGSRTVKEAYYYAPVTDIKSISAAGYATYCSNNALDFSNVEGLTAYVAIHGTEKDIEFVPVTTVPAGQGVLLKGDQGNYRIPVIADAETISENLFIGVIEDTNIDAGAGFVLMASPKVGFYKNKNAFTVSARTAYLPATASGRAFIGFDDETTGIKTVSNAAENNGMIFNLNGQRVSSPKGGLYIKNGKKVIIK